MQLPEEAREGTGCPGTGITGGMSFSMSVLGTQLLYKVYAGEAEPYLQSLNYSLGDLRPFMPIVIFVGIL